MISDVKRGQIFEAEDNLSRPRTSSRPEKAVLNKTIVSVQHHQKYSPRHYTDEMRSK